MKILATTVGVVLLVCSELSIAQTISPRRLVEVADLSTPVVSPDGRNAAFRIEQASIDRNTYDSVWYVQSMERDAPPRRVGEGGVPLRDSAGVSLPAVAKWSPDGRYVYYLALMDGRIDVRRAAVDGSGAEPMTHDAADVRDFLLSDDGQTLRYSVGVARDEVKRAEQEEYDRGIHIDGTVPVGAALFRSSFVGGRLATQRYRGSWFERGPLLADVVDRWREIDLDSRKWRELTSPHSGVERLAWDFVAEETPAPSLVVPDPDSMRVALLRPQEPEDRKLGSGGVELSIRAYEGASKVVTCHADPCVGKRITNAQWRPGGREVLFTVTDRDAGYAQSVFRWDVDTGAVLPVVLSRGLVNGGRNLFSSCGLSVNALACVAAEADGPPRLERIDIESGERHVMFEPNAALAADLAETVSTRLLHWQDESGQGFSGHLFQASNWSGSSRPLFVTYYYCSGFLRGGVGDEWPLASLAEAGISALCINAPPVGKDAIARYEIALSGVASAIEMLAAEGIVDSDRVGMGGLSFGSDVTMWVATESNLLKAASVTSPQTSPLYYLIGSLKGEGFLSRLRTGWGLGPPEETPELWERLSPTRKIDRVGIPLLLQMPEEEYIYALDYVVPLIRRQQADLYVFPHEPHLKFQPRHLLAAYERNLDWFRFWLQGVEDDDPRKTEQYKHWRLMREAASNPPRATRMDKF